MKRNPARPSPTPAPAVNGSAGNRQRLLLVSLLLACAVLFAAYRIRGTLSHQPERLYLANDVALTPPPPLPGDDRLELKQKLTALEQSRKTAQASPNDPTSQLKVANEAMGAGDRLSALAGYRKALSITPKVDHVVYEAKGHAESDLGLLEDAKKTYQQLIAASPESAAGYLGLSLTFDLLHKRQDAITALENGISKVPVSDTAGRLELAKQFETFGDAVRALKEAEAVHAAAPDHVEASLAVVHLLIKLERPADARAILDTLLAKNPETAQAKYQLAVAINSPLSAEHLPARVENLLLETIQQAPQDTPAYKLLGQLYHQQGRYKQEAYIYTKLLEQSPDSANARLQLSYAYAKIGDATAADQQQQIAKKLLARDQESAALLIRVHTNPTDPEIHLQLGRHYIKAGMFARALPELQAAYSLSSRNAAVQKELTRFYQQVEVTPPSP
jgi:tetratricopeptide (TPR) repeat protein